MRPKAREVGRDDVKAVAQARDEVPEHVARGGKAVQQQQIGPVGRPGLAIEDVETIDSDRAIVDESHLGSLRHMMVTRLCDRNRLSQIVSDCPTVY